MRQVIPPYALSAPRAPSRMVSQGGPPIPGSMRLAAEERAFLQPQSRRLPIDTLQEPRAPACKVLPSDLDDCKDFASEAFRTQLHQPLPVPTSVVCSRAQSVSSAWSMSRAPMAAQRCISAPPRSLQSACASQRFTSGPMPSPYGSRTATSHLARMITAESQRSAQWYMGPPARSVSAEPGRAVVGQDYIREVYPASPPSPSVVVRTLAGDDVQPPAAMIACAGRIAPGSPEAQAQAAEAMRFLEHFKEDSRRRGYSDFDALLGDGPGGAPEGTSTAPSTHGGIRGMNSGPFRSGSFERSQSFHPVMDP